MLRTSSLIIILTIKLTKASKHFCYNNGMLIVQLNSICYGRNVKLMNSDLKYDMSITESRAIAGTRRKAMNMQLQSD